MNNRYLKIGELYKIELINYGCILYNNKKSIYGDDILKYEYKTILMLQPEMLIDSDRGLGFYSKILINNEICYVRSSILKNFEIEK